MRDRIANQNSSSGLTLMELIITMMVMGILLAAASPLLAQFSSGYRLRGAAREVATDLQFARLLAVKENRSFKVEFTSNSYQVVRVSDNFVAKSRSFSVDYPEVTLAGLTITFNSRGNSLASNTITVSNPMGTRNITVVSTGRVKLG
jgi:type IV fimbrial biogenesis protein FimT